MALEIVLRCYEKKVMTLKRGTVLKRHVGKIAILLNLLLCLPVNGETTNKTPLTLRQLQKEAELGNIDAKYLLGVMYASGDGLPRDLEKARFHLSQAAEHGDSRAQNLLGVLSDPLWFGGRSKEDADRAQAWYLRAASQGDKSANFNLKVLKERGLVAEQAPPQLLLQRASLSQKPGTLQKQDSKQIFALAAPAIAEVFGDGNYGSGVIVGELVSGKGGPARIRLKNSELASNFEFHSRQNASRASFVKDHFIVLTNVHVLEGNQELSVALGSDEQGASQGKFFISGACFMADRTIDLAAVFVEKDDRAKRLGESVGTLEIYNERTLPAKGSTVFAVGNPAKLARTITQGLFNGSREEGLQFDAPISTGSSGGALVDEYGRLIGITTQFVSEKDTQNLNFAISYNEILDLLSGIGVKCFSR